MIGDGGLSLVGSFVKKRIYPARWQVTAAVKDGFPPRWKYTLSLSGLKTDEVFGDDDDWVTTDTGLSKSEQELAEYLSGKISPDIKGTVKAWLLENENPLQAVSDAVKMDAAIYSESPINYLWSCGAADCVIVAAYSNGKAFLTHATRVSGGATDAIFKIGHDAKIYLSSQYFGLSPVEAAKAGTVQEIVRGLMKYNVVGCYGSGRLAINARTGAVITSFPNPKAAKDQESLKGLLDK